MEMTGERRIQAPRQKVWDALNDPEALKAAIPGCESVERTAEDQFQARVAMRIGPMAAKFGGKVTLSNINPPQSYTITGEGNGGAMGFAKGGADVLLEEATENTTLLRYNVKAQVGGKMAQLGARLIDSTAKQMADQFFDRFASQLSAPAVAAAAAAAAAAPAGAVTGTGRTTVVSPPQGSGIAAPSGSGNAAPQVTDSAAASPEGPPPVVAVNEAGRSLSSLFAMIPRDPMGLPIVFWIGSAAMIVVLLLLFVIT
ncbi:SRPBCC family protein [Roseomonas sp. BN140053]|uniref:SRPBCC family protein n=1 Tax=Roseomonas sp. BN140053 TaxID=3391898 RepID=UPI0039E87178